MEDWFSLLDRSNHISLHFFSSITEGIDKHTVMQGNIDKYATEDPIKAFENDMEALVKSIQQYAPNQTCSSSLIKDSDKIGAQVKSLYSRLDQHKSSDLSQKRHDRQLTSSLLEALKTLVDCKRDMDNLPKLHDYTASHNAETTFPRSREFKMEDTRTVLTYALKLSKFSKIPRTFDGTLLPNNFTWPGDDNMRRGNLAIASMMPEKLIQFENYGADYVPPAEEMDVDEAEETKIPSKAQDEQKAEDHRLRAEEEDEEDEDDFIPERTTSIENINKKESTAVMAGLDLLDSDEE